MRHKQITYMAAMFLFAALGMAERVKAQQQPEQNKLPHFRVVNLGTLGGTASTGNTINNLGVALGSANLEGDTAAHATAWFYGLKQDLGTLGGANSTVAWPNRNDRGVIAGISETANLDPLKEQFSCPAFFPLTGHSCEAFVWQLGAMTQLPTLGGNNAIGAGINNRGEIVGWAEDNVHDATCVLPQILQFEAVIWGPDPGEIRALRPYPGDQDSAATAINDLGQVVGISGTCDVAIGAFSAKHAVLWENGMATDLGNLGGAGWNTPAVINNRGQIGGFADVAGDVSGGALTPNFNAFLWTRETGMVNLHTLPGDAISEVTGLNDEGQTVGVSFTAGFASSRAFFWQNGRMVDLNALIPANSPLYLISTGDINDSGIITAQACVLAGGTCSSATTAVLLIPTQGDEDGELSDVPRAAMPDGVRQQTLHRLGMGSFAVRP